MLGACLQGELPYEIGFECLGEQNGIQEIQEVFRQSPICRKEDETYTNMIYDTHIYIYISIYDICIIYIYICIIYIYLYMYYIYIYVLYIYIYLYVLHIYIYIYDI